MTVRSSSRGQGSAPLDLKKNTVAADYFANEWFRLGHIIDTGVGTA
jgi:hypothetical protein